VKNSNLGYLTSLAAGALSGSKSEELDHWSGKKFTISVSPEQRILCDDSLLKTSYATFEIIRHALSIVVPK
jgi:diacylglycerol kinase family enzyme